MCGVTLFLCNKNGANKSAIWKKWCNIGAIFKNTEIESAVNKNLQITSSNAHRIKKKTLD